MVKYSAEYAKEEIKAINDEVNRPGIELSNPALLIDHSLEIISNLSDFWVSSDYDDKRKLQEVLFPGGVLFEKQSNNYRTREVNTVLRLTHSISNDLGGNKKGQTKKISDLPGLVDLTDRLSNLFKQLYAVSQQVMNGVAT